MLDTNVFNRVVDNDDVPLALFDDRKVFTKLAADDGLYDRLRKRLIELDRASGKKPRDEMNQSRDARIAETAMMADLTLVHRRPQPDSGDDRGGWEGYQFRRFLRARITVADPPR